jgi:hypothetical protein
MQENIWVQIFWVACVGTAIVASVLATWSQLADISGVSLSAHSCSWEEQSSTR